MAAGSAVHRYHDGTKHHFERFARSLGYLDWASQPRPFRHWPGAPPVPLWPHPDAPSAAAPAALAYDALFTAPSSPAPLTASLVGDLLRHALGLSAWKVAGSSRWALRVNPSSGNLHPTEAYVLMPPVAGISPAPAVFHYAPDTHHLERRAVLEATGWHAATGEQPLLLVALTSIHWRESWKYGERAFRYCQHDLGHAMAALVLAARLHGWEAQLLPWSSADSAAVCGIDRDDDFVEAEREEPGAVLAIWPAGAGLPPMVADGQALAALARAATWSGQASQLSDDHVTWSFIDEIADATRVAAGARGAAPAATDRLPATPAGAVGDPAMRPDARALMRQRRSAVAFDMRTALSRASFLAMLARVMPVGGPPWRALPWPPAVHLLLFVHRVTGVDPGLYVLARSAPGLARLQSSLQRQWAWEPVHGALPLYRLGSGDCRALARRLSCTQDIAADGAFSLGMLAEFDAPLASQGDAFYRRLFWETGVIGQVLYLEAEAVGLRGTGIGCFFDDGVHAAIGIEGHAFQSLYHFTVGGPVEDGRLQTEPGYDWERSR